ncbi:hypothetical protein ABPG74_018048 [Tetrahymena malaccensis]
MKLTDIQEVLNYLKQAKGFEILQEKVNRVLSEEVLFFQSENQENYVIKFFNLQSEDDQNKICEQKLNEASNYARFLQECDHKNIPKYIDSFKVEQFYLIIVEAFDTSLYNWSQSVENFYYIKNDVFIKYSQELFSVVEYIDSKGYLLKNLSLQNIYIDKNLNIKILDFGEAQSITPSIETKKFLAQQPGSEYFYLAPEFFDYSVRHDKKYEQVKQTKCADIWVIGICLYALAGADLYHIQQYTQGKDFFQYNLYKVDLELRQFVMDILCYNTNSRPQAIQLIEKLSNINMNPINERTLQIQLNQKLNQELVSIIQEGKKYFHNQQYEQALQQFKKALERNSQDYEVLNLISQIYLQQKQFDQAEAILKQALMLNPQNALSLKLQGDLMNKNSQETQDIISHYERCIKIYPEYGELYYNLCCIQQIPLEESIYYLEKFNKMQPQSNFGLKKLGMLFAAQQKQQKALNQFKKALSVNPFDFECYNLAAEMSYQLKNIDQVLANFNQSLSINPDQAKPYYYKGLMESDSQQQLLYFKKAIQIDPYYYEAFNQIGNFLNFDHQFTPAIQYFKKTISIQPNIIDVYYTLAYIYRIQISRPEKALKVFKKIHQLQPGDEFLMNQIKYTKPDV